MSLRASVAIAVLLWTPASAQTPPGPPFVLQSENGDNRLQLGAMVHVDGRFTVDDPRQDVTDTFLVRRARGIVQGRVARYFDYFVVLDLANPQVVRDAYFETRLATAFRIRAGKGKVPFGLERLHFVNVLLFAERALPSGLTPDRDVGVQLLGDLAGGRVSYIGAVMNGAADGASVDLDTNEGKAVAGRLVVRPWVASATHPLSGLGLAVAATTESQSGVLPVFRSGGQQVFFSYSGATPDGRRNRLSPQAFYYRGPFGGFAEYIRSSGGIRKGAVRREVDHTGWEISGSWVLTGEPATDRGVRPRASFDPPSRQFGALQLAARVHTLGVGADAVTLGFAAPGASRKAQAVTVGANWYLNPFIKWVFNVERTVFDGEGQARPAENAVLLRGQLSF